MKNKIVLAKEVFYPVDLPLISRHNPDILICNECYISDLPSNLQLIQSNTFKIEGTWETYNFNLNVIERLFSKHENLFKCLNYNIRPAIAKLMYWSNFQAGSIRAYLKNLKSENFVVKDLTYFNSGNKFKEVLKFVWLYLKHVKKYRNNIQNVLSLPKAKIGFLIKENLEFKLYEQLLKELKDTSVVVFHYGNLSEDFNEMTNPNLQFFNLGLINAYESFPLINLFKLDKNELQLVNKLIDSWNDMASELKRYEYIKNSGVKCLMINEGENIAFRNLLKVVLGNNTAVLNTMNGMKAGEAQDADVNFDKWFVWDNQMKHMMMNKCNLPDSMLVNVGHLAEDIVSNYTFENTMDLDFDTWINKKIITVFSVKGNRKEKLDVENALINLIENEDDYIVIYKQHPLEKPNDFLFKNLNSEKLIVIKDSYKNSKNALYDLLYLSDLAIVFGSTVALESTWFKTPCISVEYHNSNLYFQENKYVSHIDSITKLEIQLHNLKKKAHNHDSIYQSNISKKIADYLKAYELDKNSYF
ncbi:MAG: hypothetical protein IT245_08370 [Bacteroidia bacterium]|nr:hypothetical protein [Bacteroidia bacterium]